MRILFPDDATQVDVLASFEHTV